MSCTVVKGTEPRKVAERSSSAPAQRKWIALLEILADFGSRMSGSLCAANPPILELQQRSQIRCLRYRFVTDCLKVGHCRAQVLEQLGTFLDLGDLTLDGLGLLR